MEASFLDFMKHMGVFIICAQTILHFVAGKSYEKYVKLLIGIIILAQFITPVRQIFLGREHAGLFEQIEVFEQQIKESMDNAEIVNKETKVADSVKKEIKSRLEGVAEKYGYEIYNIEIYEETQEVNIEVIRGKKPEMVVRIDKVEIQIERNEIDGKNKKEREQKKEIPAEMEAEFVKCLGTESTYLKIREVSYGRAKG